jgi:tripartite-type tricarboxylate transporter receptor subunit TctC
MIALMRLATVLLVLVVLLPFAEPTVAQSYPARPVKLVVPYPPGGPNDMIARLIAQKLSASLGGQFYVENAPGASGTTGTAAVANSAADGHTLLIANQDLILQPLIKGKVRYDPFKGFAPVSSLVAAPEVIVVHPSLPARDVKELIALLKANPGKFSYASPGYGTPPHLACEWLFRIDHGLDVVHVPFQGAAPAVQSVLAGQIPIFSTVVPNVISHVRQGTMRALAVASARRSSFLPDVPTLAEAGIPGHEVSFWMGMFAPANSPKSVVDLLQQHITAAMHTTDVRERLSTLAFEPLELAPEAFAAYVQAETAKWSKVVRDANIKID